MQLPDTENTVVLIMAGGVGSRLWPISSTQRPKQFCHLVSSDETMIQSIFALASTITDPARIYVSTNTNTVALVESQLPSLEQANIITEPAQSGTTASIAYSSLMIRRKQPDASIVVLSSDCVIEGGESFLTAINSAIEKTRCGNNLVSIGIAPTEPHTGYGYMECGTEMGNHCYQGVSYIEKPSADHAQKLLDRGGYLWNSGIFVWHVDVIISALTQMVSGAEQFFADLETENNKITPDQAQLTKVYNTLESTAIDNSLMEKINAESVYRNIFVEGCFYWNDLGTYKSLKDTLPNDDNGNAISGSIDQNTDQKPSNCIFYSEHPYKISSGPIENMIVSVCKEGNILILPLENDQHLKILLDAHTDVSCDTRTGLIFSESSEEASTSQPMCSSSFTIPDESKLQIVHLHDLRVSVENFEVRINC